ncbi:unnamed protein product [Arctia plantaginis]|uniref:Ubiquinone biosynthesis monooxygenase COQ6 n=1 Tax=Arctia plantaginis TaxID=874455 RepID=A0A8S1AAY4_ARCPL|nr:unnamed protein product [Arctia plantaginis]
MLINSHVKRFLVSQFKLNSKLITTSRARTTAAAQTTSSEDIKHLDTTDPSVNYKGNYDIIIAGGGMVGCTLACALAKHKLLSNLKVLLLESSPSKKTEISQEYSNRVVALNQNTKSLMQSLNIWKHVEKIRLQPVRYMQVWDASSDAMISFSSAELLDDDVAYIVENDVLLHAVNTELHATHNDNVNILYNAKIAGYQLPTGTEKSNKSIVKMANGDTYTCQLLVSTH